MNWLKALFYRVRSLFQKEKLDQELDEEVWFHVQQQTKVNMEAGMNPEEARYAALRRFGGIEQMKERCRDVHGLLRLDRLIQDVRFGLRMLVKTPGFTAVAVFSLALGIGANTAIFSVVNTVILNPLPQKDASQLVQIRGFDKAHGRSTQVNPQTWHMLKQLENHFSDLVVYGSAPIMAWKGEDFREDVFGCMVSPNFFSFWEARPLLGRTFAPHDAREENGPVIVLSEEFWQSHCNGRPDIVGQRVEFDEKSFVVIGVMPSHVHFPYPGVRFWLPFDGPSVYPAHDPAAINNYYMKTYDVVARLSPNITTRQLQSVLDVIAKRQVEEAPQMIGNWDLRAQPLRYLLSAEEFQRTLLSLLAVIGFVLLIACANIVNLLLARNEAREHELSIRAALGASRWRVMQQLLIESILLAVLGGTLSVVVSWTGVHLLKSIVPWNMPIVRPIGLDASMLGFTLTVSLTVGVAVGIIPVWLVNRGRTTDVRRISSQPLSAPRTGNLVRRALVISEVAMALVLLTGAALMILSVIRLLHVDPGYDSTHLVKVRVSNPFQGFGGGTKEGESQSLAQMQERLAALPGVERVGVLSHPNFFMEQFRDEGSGQSFPVDLLGTGVGAADLFQAMRIPLVEGRYFEDSDMKMGRSTVIVNATLARLCWPGQSAVGKRLHDVREKEDTGWEVIGVVGDVVWWSRDESARPAIYRPSTAFRGLVTDFLVIRTRSDPRLLISAMGKELKTVEPAMRRPEFALLAQSLYDSTAKYRIYMHFLIGFGVTGLLLSVLGIYGVSTWTVVRRTKEIGIRMAVGASPTQAMGLVLRQGMVVTSLGILIGLVAALGLTRFLRSYLFTVSPIDPLALVGASILLGAVAVLACYIPARRAARVDPMVALRYE